MDQHRDTRGLVVSCFATYVSVYLCRVNFSAAMTRLSEKLTLDYGMLGAAGAAFFVAYALGQLLNGMIGDHINPFRFIVFALCGTVACNVGVGLAGSFGMVFLTWGLNGYFQSIFWSTLIRILALKGDRDKQASLSSTISSAMPAGYLLSWCVLTPVLDGSDPKWNFFVPAALALCMIPLWVRSGRRETLPPVSQRFSLPESTKRLLDWVKGEKMALLLAACVCHGLIKEGIGFWIPSLIRQLMEKPAQVYGMMALLPIANFSGTQLAKMLLHRKEKLPPLLLVAGCFGVMLPLCVLMNFSSSYVLLLLMALVSCCSYGANTILMSYIPMQYRERNMVSSVVGVLDFCSYMGAAISSYALGSVMDRYGFSLASWIWLGAAVVAIGLLLWTIKKKKALL